MNSSFRPFRRLRALHPFFIAVSLLPAAHADSTVERSLNGDFTATTHAVRVDHSFGPVRITGVDSDFGWNWKVTGDASREADAAAFIKDCKLEVKETTGTLQLTLVLPENRQGYSVSHTSFLGLFSWTRHSGVNVHSELELRIPHSAAVELKNRFGSTAVSALTGAVNLENQNGRVELSDLSGAVTASTSFSSLRAHHLGTANLRNQNGGIDVSEVERELKAMTSFARITARDIKGQANLQNQNGEIEATGVDGDLVAKTSFARLTASDIKGRADLKNQNGAIDARGIAKDIFAATSFSRLHVEDVRGTASLFCQNGRIEVERIGDNLTASNTFAPMYVSEVRGTADLQSENGEIGARGVDGNIRAKTSFAKMALDGAGKRFDASNQYGAVQITARSPAVERIAASASFAPIDVRLTGDLQPLIRANTSFGKVRSDYPILVTDASSDAKLYADTDQPKIDLRGQNGDIRIKQMTAQ